jgi:HEAT repeat protein
VITFLAALALANAPAAQERNWVEVRFHRVHLKNGNFVDGDLLRQTDREVILRLKPGEMSIRTDMVARVEFIKIRSLNEKPPVEPPPKPPAAEERRDPFQKPTITSPEKPPDVLPSPGVERPPDVPRTVETYAADPETKRKVDEILAGARRANPNHKYQVLEGVVAVGGDAAPYLASLLETMDDELQGLATMMLTQMKDPRALPILTKLLGSKSAAVRTNALTVIGAVGGPENARDLHPLLRDEDRNVRDAAVTSIEQLGSPDSFDPIAQLLLDPDPSVRKSVVSALTALSQKHERQDQLVNALTDAVGRGRGETVVEALGALGVTGKKDVWTFVAPYLSDDSPLVRAAAATAIANLGASEAGELIVQRLYAEEDRWVRLQLASAAQRLRLQKAIDPLIDIMAGTDDNDFRSSIARVLQGITGQNFGNDPQAWSSWWPTAKPKE